jgi:hypothetical protein
LVKARLYKTVFHMNYRHKLGGMLIGVPTTITFFLFTPPPPPASLSPSRGLLGEDHTIDEMKVGVLALCVHPSNLSYFHYLALQRLRGIFLSSKSGTEIGKVKNDMDSLTPCQSLHEEKVYVTLSPINPLPMHKLLTSDLREYDFHA